MGFFGAAGLVVVGLVVVGLVVVGLVVVGLAAAGFAAVGDDPADPVVPGFPEATAAAF